MNNQRLLTGVVAAMLLSAGVCVHGQQPTVITLDELFQTAENNSIQLRPYFTAEREAEREIDVAKSNRLPDINASLSFSYIADGFTTKRNFSDYQRADIPHFGNGLSLNINQPVYAGGAITAGIEMAELKLTASRYATELNRDNIRFQLTGFYLDLYKQANLRKVVESNRRQAVKVLEEMRSRYEQGVALKNDITRYELLISNLDLQLIKINNTLAILNRHLVEIAGLPEHTVILPDTTILDRSLPMAGESVWQEETTANAPTLRLARSKVEMMRTAETLAKSELRPKIGLQAGWTIDGPILVEVPPINRNLSYWFVGVGVSYNLSSLFKGNKAVAKSRVASVHAMDELSSAQQNLSLAVHSDYVRYLESYEELKTQTKSVELATVNYNTVLTRYTADMALITDLLDAANSKLSSEQELVNARINIIYYYYKLLFTSGQI